MGFFESFKSGYDAVGEMQNESQEKKYLAQVQQAPAGAIPDSTLPTQPDSQSFNSDSDAVNTVDLINKPAGYDIPKADSLQTPKSLGAVYGDAEQLALKDNNPSLAKHFNKLKNEYTKEDTATQSATLKLGQQKLDLLSQEAGLATSKEDLYAAIDSTIKDPAMQLQFRSAIKNLSFEQGKTLVEEASLKSKEKIQAHIEMAGSKLKQEDMQLKKDTLLKNEKIEARKAAGQEVEQAIAKTKIAIAGGYEPEEIEKLVQGFMPKGEGAATTAAETTAPRAGAPLNEANKNPLNLMDASTGKLRKFESYEEGKAAGLEDLSAKFDGTSRAYKSKFGSLPLTPERLAETWSPAKGQGNSKASTDNYAKAIADAAGVEVGEKLPNTPEVKEAVFKAMERFEGGPNYKAGTTAKEEAGAGKESVAKLDKLYETKRGGGLTPKEWSTIGPTALNIGKEYKINPVQLTNISSDERKAVNSAYSVTKEVEDVSKFIQTHKDAAGTFAAIAKKVGAKTENFQNNVEQDSRFTGDVAVLGKKLFTLGLTDASAVAGGKLNQFLEKNFTNIYDQSQAPATLMRILKDRQDASFKVLDNTYGAKKDNLNKKEYGLAFTDNAEDYLKTNKSSKNSAITQPYNDPDKEARYQAYLKSQGK